MRARHLQTCVSFGSSVDGTAKLLELLPAGNQYALGAFLLSVLAFFF